MADSDLPRIELPDFGYGDGPPPFGDSYGTGHFMDGLGPYGYRFEHLPEGLTQVKGVSRPGLSAPDVIITMFREGEHVFVACTEGFGLVIRDGQAIGCRPFPEGVSAASG